MAHLISKHDPYHVHKTLGLLGILNFLFRVVYHFVYGYTFGDQESRVTLFGSLAVHTGLSVTALLLPLPVRRMFTKPMIWPEFRLHNIVFALRHVIATFFIVSGVHSYVTSHGVGATLLYRLAIVLIPCAVADIVTTKYGDLEKRTTNAMPYPKRSLVEHQVATKAFYAGSQFMATAMAATDDADAAFWPVLAIQLAAFCMTLVRKGILDSHHYHLIYSVALLMPSMMFFRSSLEGNKTNVYNFMMWSLIGYVTKEVRLRTGINKYFLWMMAVFSSMVLQMFVFTPKVCPPRLAQCLSAAACAWFFLDHGRRTVQLCTSSFGLRPGEKEPDAKEEEEEEEYNETDEDADAKRRIDTENVIMKTMKSAHELSECTDINTIKKKS